MTKLVKSLLNRKEISAIIDATHQDIFAVLGMHQLPKENKLIVRTFLPDAKQVDVVDCKTKQLIAPLSLINTSGLFEGVLKGIDKPFKYQLKVTYANKSMGEQSNSQSDTHSSHIRFIDDPYSYPSLITANDLYLFCEGTHEHVYRWMGAHAHQIDGISGTNFVLWAPDAKRVSVVGDFNQWDGRCHVMRKHPAAGVWEIFIPNVKNNALYKYEIIANDGTLLPLKADPYAFAMQSAPETASKVVHQQTYDWQDQDWMADRESASDQYHQPVSIYEVHLGSWRRKDGNQFLTYHELAEQLIPYVLEMGFTHLQLMPVSEYPFEGSWGYQPIGLFSPTSRFGTPEDFQYFVDQCHQAGLGVLLDWVPGHFPTDAHGKGQLDGTHLYEHQDKRKGFHPDWKTLIYNYGRSEVQSYLVSNAIYWLDQFHIDGLRVDAVASMLYLDYSRQSDEWVPNVHGGRENLEAIALLKSVNSRTYANYPGIMMVAEESTAWPGVSKPIEHGGLGFGFKWNMGWMNDTLSYMSRDPIYRKHHHNDMTFGLIYSFSENFVLPLSHDEVVHGKGSLLHKMPGDDWQKFANLRAYLGFMWTHPGKKLLFMGGEFAQRDEWNHDKSLCWHLLQYESHQGVQQLVKDLNHLYRNTPALYEIDFDESGFEWIDSHNTEQSIFSFIRKGKKGTPPVVVIANMTPTPHHNFHVNVPLKGYYREMLNTDSTSYGGSNVGNQGGVTSQQMSDLGSNSVQHHVVSLSIAPLATMIFQWQPDEHNQ